MKTKQPCSPLCSLRSLLFFIAVFSLVPQCGLYSQQFSLLDVNTSRFPVISARIYPYTTDGKRIDSLKAPDVIIRDNGIPCSAEEILCPAPLPVSPQQSLLLALDISASTSFFSAYQNLEEYAVNHFSDQLRSKNLAEAAVTVFDNSSFTALDFTANADQLTNILTPIQRISGTDYTQAFLQSGSGALSLMRHAHHAGNILFITDGLDNMDTAEVMKKARLMNVRIYCIMLNNAMPQALKDIATASGGAWFERVNDKVAMQRACHTISGLIMGAMPCTVRWRVANPCDSLHHVDMEIPLLRTTHGFDYRIDERIVAQLQPSGEYLNFGRVPGGSVSETLLELRAINYPLHIDSVRITGMPFFHCDTTLKGDVGAGDKKSLRIHFAPKDSSFAWARIRVYSSQCRNVDIALTGGYPGVKPSIKTIRLLSPNGGEILSSFSSTQIRWEGSSMDDEHLLELSSDGGNTWTTIRDGVRGDTYNWNVPELQSEHCLVRVSQHGGGNFNKGIMQSDASDAQFMIIPIGAAMREINMQQSVVGTRKDSVIRLYIHNPETATELQIRSIRIDGEHAPEFGVASNTAPYSLKPGDEKPIEFFFKPAQPGLREAVVIIGTNYGYRTHRMYGYGIIPQIIMPDPVDIGNVEVGDSIMRIIPVVITNKTPKSINISSIVPLGPDTAQFSIVDRFMPFSLKSGESYSLAVQYKPTHEGQASTRFGFVTGEFGSPHALTVYGQSGTTNMVMSDATQHRGIVIPNAIVPAAGTVTVGIYDLLGLTASYSITDNLMLIAGGVLPLTLNEQTSQVISGGVKYGTALSEKFSVGAGYQFASSSYDKKTTADKESAITMHVPYGVFSYGDDSSRVSLMMGYALKHHVTNTTPEGFDANAFLASLSADYRIGARWKVCAEVYSFQTLGYVPVVATVRFLGKSYSIDAGVAFTGITTGDTKAPSLPLLPVVSCVWSW